MPLSRFFTYAFRRWAYAVGEVASITVFAVAAAAIFSKTGGLARIGPVGDPGMARITAICFLLVSSGLFVIVNCLKQIDHD